MRLALNMISAGHRNLKAASTADEMVEATASVYEKFAWLFEDDLLEHPEINSGHPLCQGDLKSRSGLGYLEDSTFLPQTPAGQQLVRDQDLTTHGLHFRQAANILRDEAARLRLFVERHGAEVAIESLRTACVKRLERLMRQHYIPMDTTPGRFYTNLIPDSYNAKQYLIDFCMTIMGDMVGFFDVPVLNSQGKIELWAVPMKLVRETKERYGDVLTLDSRYQEGEDLRYEWHERPDHDINHNLCEIWYIDNSAHYQRHAGELNVYPTNEGRQAPVLNDREYYDVVYRNGARLRLYGDGHQETIGELPANAAAILMLPGTKRHEHVAKMIRQGNNRQVLY
ncbi:MAG: hypothetical protein Q8O57_12955, partial [Kiritimatiellota bacterium]|nr:hypothetical protein [Kiritimatiellota bacterium]